MPKFPTLFGEKEGKIARANRGRDPLYLFSALQRQLGYPEVPRPRRPDEAEARDRPARTAGRPAREPAQGRREPTSSNDVDLSQVLVKPEDTAGPPAGLGRRSLDVDEDRTASARPRHQADESHETIHEARLVRSVLASWLCGGLLPCRRRGPRSSTGSSSTTTSPAAIRSRSPTSTATASPTSSPWAAAPAPGTRTRRGRSGSSPTRKQTPGIISSATADLDGDGKAEIAIAYEFAMNQPTKGKLLLAVQGKAPDDPWTLDADRRRRQHPPPPLGRRRRRQAARPRRRADLRPRGQGRRTYDQTRPRLLVFSTGDDPRARNVDGAAIVGEPPVLHAIEVIDVDGDGRSPTS